jgi:hypothetical protein
MQRSGCNGVAEMLAQSAKAYLATRTLLAADEIGWLFASMTNIGGNVALKNKYVANA